MLPYYYLHQKTEGKEKKRIKKNTWVQENPKEFLGFF
jgi:hypothetical protein